MVGAHAGSLSRDEERRQRMSSHGPSFWPNHQLLHYIRVVQMVFGIGIPHLQPKAVN